MVENNSAKGTRITGILMVHGFSGSCIDFEPLIQEIQNRPYSTHCRIMPVDLHPNARAMDSEEVTFDYPACQQIIFGAIRSLMAEVDDLIIIGHSTGGNLVLDVLQNDPSINPDLLILAATPWRITLDYLQRWEQVGKKTVSLSSVSQLIKRVNACSENVTPCEFPVLLLHGDDDELVPLSELENWYNDPRFLKHKRRIIIPFGQHHLFKESTADFAAGTVIKSIEDLTFSELDPENSEFLDTLLKVESTARFFIKRNPEAARHLAVSPSVANLQSVSSQDLASRIRGDPAIVNIELSTRCNLRCPHCARSFVETDNSLMTLDKFQRILDILPNSYRITLVGLGEPLLHPQLEQFIKFAAEQGRRVGLVTNAMLLDESISQRLIQSGLSSIAFSIDGPTQELCDIMRPGTKLDQVVGNIRQFTRLAADSRIDTAVFSALGRDNIHAFPQLVDLVAGLGVHVLMVTDLNFSENTDRTLWKTYTPEIASLVKRSVAQAFRQKLPVLTVRGLEEFGLRERYKDFILMPPSQLYQRSSTRKSCYSPWQTLVVNIKGDVSICDCQPEALLGNIFTDPMEAIWNGHRMCAFREQMLSTDPPQCCRICPRF